MTKITSLKQEQFTSQEGNEYVFQQPKNSKILEILDAMEVNTGGFVMAKSFPLIFKHVVVSPQDVDIDELPFKELTEVGGAAFRFLNIK